MPDDVSWRRSETGIGSDSRAAYSESLVVGAGAGHLSNLPVRRCGLLFEYSDFQRGDEVIKPQSVGHPGPIQPSTYLRERSVDPIFVLVQERDPFREELPRRKYTGWENPNLVQRCETGHEGFNAPSAERALVNLGVSSPITELVEGAKQGELSWNDIRIENAAGTKDAEHLGHHRRRILEVLQQSCARHEIVGSIREWKPAAIRANPGRFEGLGSEAALRQIEGRPGKINTRGFPPQSTKHSEQPRRAAAHFQRRASRLRNDRPQIPELDFIQHIPQGPPLKTLGEFDPLPLLIPTRGIIRATSRTWIPHRREAEATRLIPR